MSGHSKWANIKRQKAVVDAKKGATYAKLSREIIVAAKLGGADPASNFRLRQAIDRAKSEGFPNDNISRAVEKGAGSGSTSNMEELTYEGYGPGGVAVLVRCLTDNRNRTAADIRSYFAKHGGNLGESGCVGWNFEEQGEIWLLRGRSYNEEHLLQTAIAASAHDFDTSNETSIAVYCPAKNLEATSNALSAAGYKVESSAIIMTPKSTVEVTDVTTAKQLLKLLDLLENHDDVQKVFANFEMDQSWIQEFLL